MKMKKYTAATMVEAMKQVREDFGEDAVILSSQVMKTKGFFGLFQKKFVEVVAGFDKQSEKRTPESSAYSVAQTAAVVETTAQLQKEIREIKRLINDMQNTNHTFEKYPNELLPLLSSLRSQGLAQEYISQIGDTIFQRMKQDKEDFDETAQVALMKEWFVNKLHGVPMGGISYQKKYINVLGPTGVGKTTTIAKIAARALLEEKKKIGFITTDTYRIAAIEQLRTYANLLQAPVEIAYNATDFRAAIEKLADRDLIFIDTAGRNYKEAKFVDDLKKLVDFSLDMETFLVLSTTSKEQDMDIIVQRFQKFPIEKFIFTKTDETNSVGAMINLMLKYNIGTAYYTDGQEVPEDIAEADFEKVFSLLLAGDSHA
ncbi:flagellar biosynthesis protein FlhF [Sporosarcina sp. PTS2304]|uniref:flagellar biosynthesis protein FlhF n=1 Tax=Sporosarcina sp. PTS2304 TaxID=2283194 RepID=UPI000E0D2E3F|nr:flagellar biosynthesis protein FlhF [Sporosarcina sp. PTS2304]AXH98716.1 flagellar biosynthesis protein FlhF [Sporosarcina sp. PTS2304]